VSNKLKCDYVVADYSGGGSKKQHFKTKAKAEAKARELGRWLARNYGNGKMVTVSVERVCLKTKQDTHGTRRKVIKDVFACTASGKCTKVRERAKRLLTLKGLGAPRRKAAQKQATKPTAMVLHIGKQKFTVHSFEEAQRVFEGARDASGEGASSWPDGRIGHRYRISYNGRLWDGDTLVLARPAERGLNGLGARPRQLPDKPTDAAFTELEDTFKAANRKLHAAWMAAQAKLDAKYHVPEHADDAPYNKADIATEAKYLRARAPIEKAYDAAHAKLVAAHMAARARVKGLGAVSPRTRKGARVTFNAHPGSLVLYSQHPELGEQGTVTTMPGFGKRTYLPGPGGGLLYVDWDQAGTIGVSPNDVDKASKRSPYSKLKVGPGRPGQRFTHGDMEITTTLHPVKG